MSIQEGVIRRSGRWILGLPRRWRCPCCARQRVSHELAIRALVWRCYDDLGSCPRPRRCRGVGFFSTKTPGSAPGSSGGHRAISREVASCPKDFSTRPVLKKKAEVFWPPSEKIFHFMLFATRRRREPSRPAASVPLHTARHAVCSGTLAVSRRCRVRHWQRNKLPGLCSADGGVEQMKKILSE